MKDVMIKIRKKKIEKHLSQANTFNFFKMLGNTDIRNRTNRVQIFCVGYWLYVRHRSYNLDTFSKTKLYIMTHNLNSIYFGIINWLKEVVSQQDKAPRILDFGRKNTVKRLVIQLWI